ncbi:MAG: hypothetical protein GY698_18795 [Actinomycetia bacterium]|nr:hypothetical protein [Actinomycetes bacterium]
MPVWIGGSGGPARRRAARYGAGWHPMTSMGGLAKRMPRLEEALADIRAGLAHVASLLGAG